MTERPVIVALTRSGEALARRLRGELPQCELHGLDGRVSHADQHFPCAREHIRALFLSGRPVIGLMASGILIRVLAPVLADKSTEPPVVAVAEDAGAVVPLLGGHRGANALARRVARALAVEPAITTATDRRFDVALDEPPPGWCLANPEDHRAFVAALLDDAEVRIVGQAPWLDASGLPRGPEGELEVHCTERAVEGSARRLVYHPTRLAVGIGCERGADPSELVALVRETLRAHDLAPGSVAGVFSLDLKADEPAVHAAGAALGVPVRLLDVDELRAQTPRLANPSPPGFRAVGTHGGAEAAALAAVGPHGTLLVPKRRSDRATCAIARAPEPVRSPSRQPTLATMMPKTVALHRPAKNCTRSPRIITRLT